jgi:tRNA pseudouridine55 synthase
VESVDGVLVVDKPAGLTSHDVVGRMRRILKQRRIGHLGTLDPMATGVLPLVVGRATRLARFFSANDKRYDAVIRFGYTTDSYDREGKVTSTASEFHLERASVEVALAPFRGTFLQTPPPVSAKKVEGTPAYKLARKNIAFELQPVEVTVFSLELCEFGGECARILVHCSAGTYVRSIAHEVGQALGCGAVLERLRRTASGDFTEDQAHTIDALQAMTPEELTDAIIPATLVLPEFPATRVDAATAGQIRQGKDFRLSPFRPNPGARYVKAIGEAGDLVAIGEARLPNLYHPILVL